ncbi:MAG: DUF692 family protein [Chloroflexi bacterium]|nr:DUF692 family protein [Chloroflexota bacterium]
MKFAVNYSPQAAGLLQAGLVQFDLFKCPPWPDMIAAAQKLAPVTVHFPFRVGAGCGDAIDAHSGETPDWAAVERWLQETETHTINLHLSALSADYPHIPRSSLAPEHVAEVTAAIIRDVEGVVRRWGAEKVIIENDHGWNQKELRLGALPAVIASVVEAIDCGLLLDLSHARLAAQNLHQEPLDLLARLPRQRCRELHITGIQHLPDWALAHMRAAGMPETKMQKYLGRPLDHLPLVDDDWPWMRWLAHEHSQGRLGAPWLVALECGGVGPVWQAITDREALAQQIPPLYRLFAG